MNLSVVVGLVLRVNYSTNQEIAIVRQVNRELNDVLRNTYNFKEFIPINIVIAMTQNNKNRVNKVIIEDITQLDLINTHNIQYFRELAFDQYFNKPLATGVFPTSITSLTFGRYFNQPLVAGVFPTSLTSLTFGYKFNQPLVENVLLIGLTSLTFGALFDQLLVENVLPASLKLLTFGSYFDQPIGAGVLPAGLKTLIFDSNYDQLFVSSVKPIYVL